MIELRPFRALHYNPAAVGDLGAVLAPPYDVIDDAQLERLYARSRYNAVRLILNRSADRYGAAASDLAAWRAEEVLVQDSEPCFYYYVQDFELPGGGQRQRGGLMAAVRLESFEKGNIRPHERTFPGPKADRLRLMNACRTNLSPIFGVFPQLGDPLAPARAQSEAQAPWMEGRDETGGRHRVWRLPEAETVERIRMALRDATLFIADGHHRYETALTYRDQRRAAGETDPNAPHNFLLMYLCPMNEPGLVILPTHRLWRGPGEAVEGWLATLAEHFDVEELPLTPQEAVRELLVRLNEEVGRGCLGLQVGKPQRGCLLRLREGSALDDSLASLHPVVRDLDVTILDAFVLRRLLGVDCDRAAREGLLAYTHDDGKAIEAVARGDAAAAFLLRVPRIGEVEAVCVAGETMPQKSTYFYPKLQTGLVFHLLDADG